jgi:nucleoside-diphosphate-sugar epimerase
MRTLVTGGHGFVGSHLVPRLVASGRRVRCLVRGARRPAALEGQDVEVLVGDLRDGAALTAAVKGQDEVFHLAALTRSRTRREMMETNLHATLRLARAAAAAGARRLVFCSSLAAAGPAPGGEPLRGDEPCRPLTWYGESKARAEEGLLSLLEDLPVTVLRPPAVYGPRDRDFTVFFEAAARGFVPLPGRHVRRYHFVYAEDLAEAFLAAADAPGGRGEAYYPSHPEVLTADDFLDRVASAVGRRPARFHLPESLVGLVARLGDVVEPLLSRPPLLTRQRSRELSGRAWLGSPERLTAATGWRATTDAAEGTRRTWAWMARGRRGEGAPGAAPAPAR